MIYKGFGFYFMVDNKLGLKGKKSLGYLKSGILLWFELIDYMKNLVRNWFVNVSWEDYVFKLAILYQVICVDMHEYTTNIRKTLMENLLENFLKI